MKLTITCTVPDDWRDWTNESFVLEAPYTDVHDTLLGLGAEDIDIMGSPDDDEEAEPLITATRRAQAARRMLRRDGGIS